MLLEWLYLTHEIDCKLHVSFSVGPCTTAHFRVPKSLTFKMRPSAQPFLWKWVLFAWEWKLISILKAEHITLFWYRGPGELGSGLFSRSVSWEIIDSNQFSDISWSHIIQVNLRNPAKFIRNQHIWNLSRSMGWIIIAVNLQIYLEFSSPQQANNFPKLPGINYAAKNLRLVMMLKALPLAHF